MARRMTRAQRHRQIVIRMTIVCMIIIFGCAAIIGFVFSGGKTVVDLNSATHIKITGFNGEGIISSEVEALEGYEDFFKSVRVDYSKNTDLTNGDKVDITYTYDKKKAKQYKLKVECHDEYITIEGLVEPTIVSKEDFFEGVNVIFDGIAPLVTATLNIEGNKLGEYVEYEVLDMKEYYDTGDVVVVRAIFDEDELEENDYRSDIDTLNCTKEFVVEKTDRYLTDAEQITDEMINTFNQESLSYFTNADEYGMRIFCEAGLMPVYIDKKTTFRWSSPSFISAYFNTLKEESYGKVGANMNDVKLCYEAVISQADGQACRAEVIVSFTDIIQREDGSIDLNLKSGRIISADRRDANIKAIVQNKIDDDYESIKL